MVNYRQPIRRQPSVGRGNNYQQVPKKKSKAWIWIVVVVSVLVAGVVLYFVFLRGGDGDDGSESVDVLNEKVINEIKAKFEESNNNIDGFGGYTKVIFLNLGNGQRARIKPGSGNFGVILAARVTNEESIGGDRLKYQLVLRDEDIVSCSNPENFIVAPLDEWRDFGSFEENMVLSIIELNVPSGTDICRQRFIVNINDTESGRPYDSIFFDVEVI
jgi:hypothetical protein